MDLLDINRIKVGDELEYKGGDTADISRALIIGESYTVINKCHRFGQLVVEIKYINNMGRESIWMVGDYNRRNFKLKEH